MRLDIRLWTAIAVIGFCGFAVMRGWNVLHFSVAMANIESSERRAEAARAWTGFSGVASAAVKTELEDKVDQSDWKASNKRLDDLSALLTLKPVSPIDWLSLSRQELLTAQPRAQILASLLLSWVTGPNEGYVMPDRGAFGLSLWEVLPPDLRKRVVADLARVEITESGNFKTVVSTKPEAVQKEIRAGLLALGLPPKEVERRLGL
jgi:hypothetical protein